MAARVSRTEKSLSSSLSHSSSSRSTSKTTKKSVICPICTEQIIDSDGRKKGHDSVCWRQNNKYTHFLELPAKPDMSIMGRNCNWYILLHYISKQLAALYSVLFGFGSLTQSLYCEATGTSDFEVRFLALTILSLNRRLRRS